ncbi:hypothetical protein FHG87_014105 [Trinorchestia longiramus]|nr:hypothetical protein FHG87_014105 [Trinorchestia longiramus]
MGAKCCLLCQAPYTGYHPYSADVNKLGSNRLEPYEGQNSAYNGKYASQNCSVLIYEPLTQNQTCQPPPSQANDLQNQAYQRGGNIYSSSSHLGYRGGVNDNLSPYHQTAPQPPNYQETVNNLYRRLSLEQNQYSDQNRSYGNGNSLPHAYSDYNAYSSETSPVHLYGHDKRNHGAYMSSSALQQSMEGMERLSKYHNYDIDKDYPPEDIYKAPGDYGSYGNGLRHLYHKGNMDLSDPDLVYIEQQRVHQQHLLLKEEEELKAEERRRKIISDVVRDGTSSGLAGVSAGELLNKTHEELVLLLIQLRRQHSALQEARKQARAERDAHANLLNLDSENRDQYLDHLAVLNRHLLELDKQYEMGKPLINLVDNMVKLGTLYRGLDNSNSPSSPTTTHQDVNNANDSLEFTRRVQERRIVDEDREEYELLTPDQADLEGKVLRLYKLEHAIQQESLALQALHTEKETLERALLALHSSSSQPPATVEEAQRRERLRMRLERELSQLRSQLALSSGKLEETAAENSRLEHEMMMLRQKIQQTMARNARRDCGDGTSKTRHIESEMLRVQALLEDLQNRRLHLSHQIHKLTMSSSEEKRLYGMHSASPPSMSGSYHSSTGTGRHRSHTTWLETDLDLMITRDLGVDMPNSPLLESDSMDIYRRGMGYDSESPYMSGLYGRSGLSATDGEGYRREYGGIRRHTLDSSYSRRLEPDEPMYSMEPPMALSSGELRNRGYYGAGYDRNAAANKPDGQEQPGVGLRLDDSDDADERMKRFYGLLPKEKSLEPKTVRIVKRESTERRKDRTYSTGSGKKLSNDSPLSHVMEDDLESDSGEQTSEPELDSESSPAHVPLAASMSMTKSAPRHHLSSSYSSGYSSSSQTYLAQQQSSYPPSTISLYQSAPDYQSSSVSSVPITTSSSVEPPPMSSATSLPSYQDRTASLPRNYGRGNEWGDRPNKRMTASNANSSTSPAAAKPSVASGNSSSSRPSNLPLKHKSAWKSKVEAGSAVSAMDQLFGHSPPVSPGKPQLPSPVFKSAAAQEIIKEMVSEAEKYRRTVPKEKRRHVTISSSKPITMETSRDSLEEGARSRDDCDMARALRPRNHPDVVKSTLSTRDLRINETTIDSIFGAPSKIHIPERYVPDEDDAKDVSPEERRRREDKALSIRRMLTESSTNLAHENGHEQQPSEWVKEGAEQNVNAESASKAKERKEREHILAMNQILARQVMEKSRLVAARANKAAENSSSSSDDDLSPVQPLPLRQQRENVLV